MKKLLALLLAAILVVGLMTACGGSGSDETTAATDGAGTTDATGSANTTGKTDATGSADNTDTTEGTVNTASGADLNQYETLPATGGDLEPDYSNIPASSGDLDDNG